MQKIRYLLAILLLIAGNALAANTITFNLTGIQGELLKNAQARLDVIRKIYPKDITPTEMQHVYKMAPKEIIKSLQPFGYYKASVWPRLTRHGDQWTANIKVTPGPTLKITSLDIRVNGPGDQNKSIQHALKKVKLQLKPGDVLKTKPYEDAKDELYTAATNAGYIKARFEKTEIQIDLQKNTAAITIYLQTEVRYYFGATTFGESPYALEFLNRFPNYKQGKPFSSQKLLDLQQDMSSSYYFDNVDITPGLQQIRHQEVPVQIDTTVPRSQRYTVGLGYGTFTGPRMTAGVNLRRLTDTGQHFDAKVQLSQVLSAVDAKYYIPAKNPLTDRWVIGTSYSQFSPQNGQSETEALLFGYIRKIHHLQFNLNANFMNEHFHVYNENSRNAHLFYPSLTIGYMKANDLINTTHGYSINLSLQGGLQQVLSTVSFIQPDIKAKYITSPFSFAKIIARGEIGYTSVENLYRFPLTMRYFAGGINSIRGFPDSSIGPGKYLQVGSLEYQNKLYGNIWGAAFYDIGAASDHVGHPINKGAGLGLIYNSVVGPVRLYLGRAISKKDQPYSVEFSVGPEF